MEVILMSIFSVIIIFVTVFSLIKIAYTDVNKEEVEQQIFTLTQFLKEKSNTVGLMVRFDDPDETANEKGGFYNIDGRDLPYNSQASDVHKYLIEF